MKTNTLWLCDTAKDIISHKDKYGFTNEGLCMFLAQLHHESGKFGTVGENFNYTKKRLLEVFPKYFNEQNVDNYIVPNIIQKNIKIASRVYANRMGNGDEDSQDGYKYSGSGWIQLTGKDNFIKCGNDLGIDLVDNPELARSSNIIMLKISIWFFKHNNIFNSTDINHVTKVINGGLNGLQERTELYNFYLKEVK